MNPIQSGQPRLPTRQMPRSDELHHLEARLFQLRVIRNASHRGVCEHHQPPIPITFALRMGPNERLPYLRLLGSSLTQLWTQHLAEHVPISVVKIWIACREYHGDIHLPCLYHRREPISHPCHP
jgi:hypothetical protein